MTIRPLTPQSFARIDWEQRVLRDLAALLDCSGGDAQDIIEAQREVTDHCWAMQASPELCAAAIDKASEAGADLSPQDALELAQGVGPDAGRGLTAAQEAIEQADAALSNAVLPTYTELLAALGSMCDALPSQQTERRRFARAVMARLYRTLAGDFR